MGRRAIAVAAGLVLSLNVVVAFVAPRIAEGVLAAALADEFSDQLGTTVEVELGLTTLGSLLQGRIATIQLSAGALVADTEAGDAIELTEISVALRHVQVDVGEALGGRLAQVEVLDSELRASLPLAVVEDFVREGIDDGGSFTFVSLEVEGPAFAVTLRAPDGSEHVELVRPTVLANEVRLLPAGPRVHDDVVAIGVRDALGELRVALPALPLGIELREVVMVRADRLVLGGRLPTLVDLS